ncbi:MAG: GHMP kinase [Pseudomonadota bacterium]
MIITRTPFRVSFVGGGSDLREFYSKSGYGSVVSAAIRKYMYIVIHPYFHDKIRVKYSKTEDVSNVKDIKHPIVKACLEKVEIDKGIEIASFADVPKGTGLGSSSSFTVGLLNALYAYRGIEVSKERLARESCEIEMDVLGDPVGKQDQYAVAYGGLNYIRFNKDETVNVYPIELDIVTIKKFEECLRLYYTGGERRSADILSRQRDNLSQDSMMLCVKDMASMADDLKDKLSKGKYDLVGEYLNKGWCYKRELASGISNHEIDAMYKKAIEGGASGGKLLGAGGAGFMLVYAVDHGQLEQKMGCRSLPFSIDSEGSKLLFRE